MTLTWQNYERLVKDIYFVLGKAEGVVIECWGPTCKVAGHQVDVLTKHNIGPHKYRTAISCKYWKTKVGIKEIRDLAQIVSDGRLNKGVVVSRMGFTRPATDYAESKGIGLAMLRIPLDRDWDGYIREVGMSFRLDFQELYDFTVELSSTEATANESGLVAGPVHWSLALNQIVIDGLQEGRLTLQQLIDRQYGEYSDETQEHNLVFPEGSVFLVPDYPEYPGHGFSVKGMKFKVRHRRLTDELAIRPWDHVYMIMESVFDGRRFHITKDGKITPRW